MEPIERYYKEHRKLLTTMRRLITEARAEGKPDQARRIQSMVDVWEGLAKMGRQQ